MSSTSDHLPATLAEASQLVFLNPKLLKFSRKGVSLSLMIKDGKTYPRVSLLRAFPLSHPQQLLSVRDEENNEIGLIANPGLLDAEAQRLIEAELERRYLIPVISGIKSAKERFGSVDWVMESDRGKCRFTTKNLRENVQRPAPNRIILNDVDENRYDIRDIDALSRESQALLFRHL